MSGSILVDVMPEKASRPPGNASVTRSRRRNAANVRPKQKSSRPGGAEPIVQADLRGVNAAEVMTEAERAARTGVPAGAIAEAAPPLI